MSDLHEIVHSDDPNWPWRCSCGEEFRTSRKHALHVREALLADPALLDALAPLVADRERSAAARALREAADPMWDSSVPPGGFVCNICRFPVESEPCADHGPDEEGEMPPCGHVRLTRGCGGCDPSAIEFIKDEGGPWVRVAEAGEDRVADPTLDLLRNLQASIDRAKAARKQHDHREYVPGCFRCDLSRHESADELEAGEDRG